MLIAHLPAGYLLGRALNRRRGNVMAAALLGAIIPDFDMIWFHLVDHGAVHHHKYWPHIPAFWIVAGGVLLMSLWVAKSRHLTVATVGLASVMIHLVLDTLGGGIMWAWPLSDHLYAAVTVPATQSHWILSFMLHWTFLAEIAICLVALVLFLRVDRIPS
jgi:inner membrane protein